MRFIKTSFLVLIVFSLLYCTAYADSNILKGDMDVNGTIDAADALLVLKHAAKLDNVDELVADVDEDHTVSATDALWILKYAAKLETEFPGGNYIIPETTETVTPTETVSPVPSETVSPVPSETVSPVPSETVSPSPSETATPTPTLTPIEVVKEYVKTNGADTNNGGKVYGYTYEDDTVTASMTYLPDSDNLTFALTYKEVTDEETMLIEVKMEYMEKFDYITLEAAYEYGDFKQNYFAKAPVLPEEVTAGTKYNFTEVSSINCSDDEKEAILSMSDMYIETAMYLWDSILTEDMSLSLKDIGFINYVSSN